MFFASCMAEYTKVLGFRVWFLGLGFMRFVAKRLGFRVQGLGPRSYLNQLRVWVQVEEKPQP